MTRYAGVMAAVVLAVANAAPARAESMPNPDNSPPPSCPARNTPVCGVTFVAFDTETTGFSLSTDRIVAINAVKFRDGEILDEARWLINSGRVIPQWALRVHGIEAESVRNAPPFPEVYKEFLSFVQGAVLLAHNARFDISFLTGESERHGLDLPDNPILDTLPLFRAWFPEADSYCAVGLALHLRLGHLVYPRPFPDSMILQNVFEYGRSRQPRADTFGALRKAAGRTLRF